MMRATPSVRERGSSTPIGLPLPQTDQQRRSYSLLKSDPVRAGELTHVPVGSLIQETDLEFDRAGMHDRIFGDASHLKVMRWNFSNVVT